MMMALGMFVFSLPTLAYQDLQRQTSWRHPSSSRVGSRPARQFTGAGDDTITLSGLLLPELLETNMPRAIIMVAVLSQSMSPSLESLRERPWRSRRSSSAATARAMAAGSMPGAALMVKVL